jgi:hypothetical protein
MQNQQQKETQFGFTCDQIQGFVELQQTALNHARTMQTDPVFQLDNYQFKLIDHIAKLKVLYRSACFTDDICPEQMLDSSPGDFGDSVLIEHLIKEAIGLHTEIGNIKSLLKE